MPAQTPHRVFPEPNHDESSRQNFVMALRMHVLKDLLGGNKEVYEARVEPAFRKEHSRPPKSRHEVRKAMDHIPYFQMYSSLLRTSQEMIWDSIGSSIERQWDGLIQKTRSNGSVRGSVTIDPALKVPPYLAAVDHHCMPGSYHTEYRNEDVFNGAIYDRGAYLYALGAAGKLHDDRGRTISAYIKRTHPSLDPRRILDMGCTVGASTLAYCDEFPEAEVCAIDIGAPMVRYGHARAEAFGRRVQFSQQNAEHTNFDDGSFDRIVSHVMLHETSRTAMINIMAANVTPSALNNTFRFSRCRNHSIPRPTSTTTGNKMLSGRSKTAKPVSAPNRAHHCQRPGAIARCHTCQIKSRTVTNSVVGISHRE
ncbi:MAG: class I SAM-dependent methyltransferase [Planctomycetes bacterium]|nr:class I SAM-dependent methyltransferase [Planctomycetota bacterium]